MKVRVLVRFTVIAAVFAFAALVIPRSASASPMQFLTLDQICIACDFSPIHFSGLNLSANSGVEHSDLAFHNFDGFNTGNGHNPFSGGDIILNKGLFDSVFQPLGDDDGDDPAPTPEPGSLLLLGSGLLSLGAVARKFSLVR
jgi:PEP-CTERM motif-containing protein